MDLFFFMTWSFVDDADSRRLCERMWEAVFGLFAALFEVNGQEAYSSCLHVFVKHWQTVAGNDALLVYRRLLEPVVRGFDYYITPLSTQTPESEKEISSFMSSTITVD